METSEEVPESLRCSRCGLLPLRNVIRGYRTLEYPLYFLVIDKTIKRLCKTCMQIEIALTGPEQKVYVKAKIDIIDAENRYLATREMQKKGTNRV